MLHTLLAILAWLLAGLFQTATDAEPAEETAAEQEAKSKREAAFKLRVSKASALLVEAFTAANDTLTRTIVPKLADRMFSLRMLFSDANGDPDFNGRSAGYRDAIAAVRAEANLAGVVDNYESLRVMASRYITENIDTLAGDHKAAYVREGYAKWLAAQAEKAAKNGTPEPSQPSAPTQAATLARTAAKNSRKSKDNPYGNPDVDGLLASVGHNLGMIAGYLDPRDKNGNPVAVSSDRAWKPNRGDVTRWTEAIGNARTLLDRVAAVVDAGAKTMNSNRNSRTGKTSNSKTSKTSKAA
jgi:hypothetical protein